MAVSYVWPVSLPQAPLIDYTETIGLNIQVTPMDRGPAKLRRRGARADQFSVRFIMTTAQVATLRTFVESTIKGVARFGFPHPRTNAQIEARLVPNDGELFSVAHCGPGTFYVAMTIEALP